MALNKYKLAATVTVAADVAATVVAGEPGTGGAAGYGNAASASPATAGKYGAYPLTFIKGTLIVLDPAPANGLYAAIGAGNLVAWTGAQETGGTDGCSN